MNKKELEITAVDVNTNTKVLPGESCYSTVILGTPSKYPRRPELQLNKRAHGHNPALTWKLRIQNINARLPLKVDTN